MVFFRNQKLNFTKPSVTVPTKCSQIKFKGARSISSPTSVKLGSSSFINQKHVRVRARNQVLNDWSSSFFLNSSGCLADLNTCMALHLPTKTKSRKRINYYSRCFLVWFILNRNYEPTTFSNVNQTMDPLT